LTFENGENEFVQQEIAVANSFEPLKWRCIYIALLKKLVIELRFKFWTMSGGSRTMSG
jgi:hypothetical protein